MCVKKKRGRRSSTVPIFLFPSSSHHHAACVSGKAAMVSVDRVSISKNPPDAVRSNLRLFE